MRKSLFTENNLKYSSQYYRAEDYALWIEALQYTKAYNLQSVLLRYRRHNESVTWYLARDVNEVSVHNLLQNVYFLQKGIAMIMSDIQLFGSFVNRSAHFSLENNKQIEISRILRDFFAQLKNKDFPSYSIAKKYVATACFYRFLKNRKIPVTKYLTQLFLFGMIVMIKKIPIFVVRKTKKT